MRAALAANANSGNAAVKLTVSVGTQSSKSQSENESHLSSGSTLKADTIHITATGNGERDAEGYAADGDIRARGAKIEGREVSLSAARDVLLESAVDTTRQESESQNRSASLGVGFGLGGQQNGFTIEIAAGGGNGNVKGTSTTHQETRVSGSEKLTIQSGRDTQLVGAQAHGGRVEMEVGRNLKIESQQDVDNYKSTQTDVGFNASLCIPPICYGVSSVAAQREYRLSSI